MRKIEVISWYKKEADGSTSVGPVPTRPSPEASAFSLFLLLLFTTPRALSQKAGVTFIYWICIFVKSSSEGEGNKRGCLIKIVVK